MDFSDNQRCSMNTLLSKLEDPDTAAPRTHPTCLGDRRDIRIPWSCSCRIENLDKLALLCVKFPHS